MPEQMRTGWPRAALLSLSDKAGAADFARVLAQGGTRLIASGGTARHLEQSGLEVTPVERWTGFPEMLGGRVKTLHPHVHGAILARRSVAADLDTLCGLGLVPIDLVAVTLYPFEQRAASLDEAAAIEEIDIGGVALLRAAAKNFADVIVLHDPAQYAEVTAELAAGGPSLEQRRRWAVATFARTARYDATIATEIAMRSGGETPPVIVTALERTRSLRYGENPHQGAALYTSLGAGSALHAIREGKELSYNNLLDVEAAVTLASRFERPVCVIVKHNQPCGVACAADCGAAFALALASDEQSAFGGIVAFNRTLDLGAAERLGATFFECIVAPEFNAGVEDALKSRKNLRLLRLSGQDVARPGEWELRSVGPWWLAQRESHENEPEWKLATQRAPSEAELSSLRFAWIVVAAARSNAIAIARGEQMIGLGSGQTSRVDAVDVAVLKARRAGHDLSGSVLASDAFFPFADNVEHAAAAGVTAIVQPGGSVRDAEVIAACDAAGIAMMCTGRRVFRH